MTEKVECRTPNPEKPGSTNIPKWKYDLLEDAIRNALGDSEMKFTDLREAVRPLIAPDQLEQLGSLGWHVTCVKLEMEVRGEIVRVRPKAPQIIKLRG